MSIERKIRTIILAILLAAFSWSARTQPPVQHVTILSPLEYLVENEENRGRHDWPLPVGYVTLTNVAEGHSTARQIWDYAPFGSYEPERGDGFQVAEIGGDGWVRITSTRDGGKPYVQHFVGQHCNGSGWLLFKADAQSGVWKDALASLNIAQDPTTCPPSLNPAYTRYRLEQVAFPFAIQGALSTKTLSTVISEHFNGRSIATSVSLERFYLSRGFGLMRWEAWGPEPPVVDLSQRCTPIEWSVAPVTGWNLHDCRTYSVVP